jgi:fimbrial chaperone protein
VSHTRTFLFSLLLAASLLAAAPAWALRVVPFGGEFDPKGSGATRTFRIENDTAAPAAVQVRMVHREIDPDGKEQQSDAEDEFVVFPPQLVLLPGESRSTRVQWIGDPAPPKELAYRLIVEQLPVDIDPKQVRGAQLKLIMRYEATVYIVPPGAKRDPVVVAAEPVKGKDGHTQLAVTVENRGTAHALLSDTALTLAAPDGRSVTLAGDRLQGMEGENVLAGHRRRFVVPWPQDLAPAPLKGSVRIGPQS